MKREPAGVALFAVGLTLSSLAAQGPVLLLHPNFAVIRRYNNSDRYALVVALLARAFEPRLSRLSAAQQRELKTSLERML